MATGFKACSVDGCNGNSNTRKGGARGYCSRHYYRLRMHGSPLAGGTAKGERIKFALEVAVKHKGNECLPWPYSRDRKGYGNLIIEGKPKVASRYVCELAHGKPPTPKHHAAHSCGNGHLGCVNPNHLAWKTRLENEADKLVHGTLIRGSDHVLAKLNEEQVREIRSLEGKEPQTATASRFGIASQTVSFIQRRLAWAWLD